MADQGPLIQQWSGPRGPGHAGHICAWRPKIESHGVLASWHENVSPQKTYLWRCPVLVKLAIRGWFHALVENSPGLL